jgi:hypothetical protein
MNMERQVDRKRAVGRWVESGTLGDRKSEAA